MYQHSSILDLWGNLRKTGVTIALFILPKISLATLKSAGSIVGRVKEGMLLLAANPRNTPPSKAVRKYVLNTFLTTRPNCGTQKMKNNGNLSFAGYNFEYPFYSAQISLLLFIGFWYRLPATDTVLYVAKERGQIHDRSRITGHVHLGAY